MSKKLFNIIGLVVLVSMVLAACAPTEVIKTVVVEKPGQEIIKTQIVVQTVEVAPPTPVPVERKGAWVDELVFTEQNSAEAAVKQLQAGDLDVYAYSVAEPAVFKTANEAKLDTSVQTVGSANEMTFNPAVFSDATRLNPFSVPAVREAMNWLIDRNYVVQEIFGGLAIPKLFCLVGRFPDYAKYVDVARKLEAKYAYNLDKAKEVITAEMEKLGATLVDGKWQFNNAPVTLIMIIRVEDNRRQIGDYVSNQLESIGFTVDRQYKTRSEASPIWVRGNPTDGLFHIYTGGWITTAVSRDDGSNFSFYYTPRDYPVPLWMAYTPDPAFDEVALKLRNNDFKSMDERAGLFKQAMEMSLLDSVRVWVNDQLSFSPMNAKIQVAYDLAGGIAGSLFYPLTLRWKDQEGGTIRIAQPGLMVDPWNPIAGSNWIYDSMPIRATQDNAVIPDPYTGLYWPQRIEKAEITVKEGLPVVKTLDWVDLKFAPEIQVPADAWVDWDATNQKFVTASEKYTDTLPTALTKMIVTYPSDLWKTVKWHDGSPITMGDFVMSMILTWDVGKPESAIYDEAQVGTVDAFVAHFKGFKIVSTDPLVIETYDDRFFLDAETSIYYGTWWPNYAYGPAAWHNLVPGILAETNKEGAFSTDKAGALTVEWLSYIAGPTLETLKKYLDQATTENYIPYAPTLGEYITAEEATLRYANLAKFLMARGHFWLGTGPFYVDKVYPVAGTMTLSRFADFPDAANRWSGFGTPMLAEAALEGPGQVKIGTEAKYTVSVTFKGQPYPSAQISEVKYLLFDAKGDLVATGVATMTAEGKYEIVLGADVTGKLEAGSNKIEVAVSSLAVSIPAFATFEFVTAP
jgi:peptide/nickel transport system substrate-binding protein